MILQPIPDLGQHLPMSWFITGVQNGSYRADTGMGMWATRTKMSAIQVHIPRVKRYGVIPNWATHVVWFPVALKNGAYVSRIAENRT